jgi:hypothetical protein
MNKPLTINNILVSSKMVRRKAILVEGTDDIKKYEYILEKSNNVSGKCLNKILKVHAVETILDSNDTYYIEGCVGVINATSDLKNNPYNNIEDLKKYILGYIDKDVRNHREAIEELPNFDILYMLDFYSIESFYVNKLSLIPLLNELIAGSKTIISEGLIELIYNEALTKALDLLHYPVLDSLKKSVDVTYTSAKYGYDKEYGFIKNNNDLLIDSEKILLQQEFPSMRKELSIHLDICKGKWLFECWLENVIEIILNLKHKCGTENLAKCDFCLINQPSKCSYKSTVTSSNMHATYSQKIFNEQPFLERSLNFYKIINRFDLMFT